MTTFDEREDAFEKKYALDEELQFKATARRNRLLGLWAAEKLGLHGADAETYAKSIVMAEFAKGGDEDVFLKIRDDLNVKAVPVTDQQIRSAMAELMARAVEQIRAGA